MQLFKYIYGNRMISIQGHGFSKYNKMTARAGLRREGVPPSSGVVTQYILCVYLQYKDWLLLESRSITHTDFGWRLDDEGQYIPITTADEIGPPELLKLAACNCKKNDVDDYIAAGKGTSVSICLKNVCWEELLQH